MLDLFSTVDPYEEILKFEQYMSKEWMDFIGPHLCLEGMQIIDKVREYSDAGNIKAFPKEENIFSAFNLMHPDDVRVVILSKCPYPNDNSDGIAFSCVRYVTPSMRQLAYALTGHNSPELVNEDHFPYAIGLYHWPKQGVLCTNVQLQVLQGDPNSLSKIGWREFMYSVSGIISARKPDVPFLLLGKDAHRVEKYLTKTNKDRIFKCDHPKNATMNNSYWSCNYFDEINSLLDTPIQWLKS